MDQYLHHEQYIRCTTAVTKPKTVCSRLHRAAKFMSHYLVGKPLMGLNELLGADIEAIRSVTWFEHPDAEDMRYS